MKFHSPPESGTDTVSESGPARLGLFALKEETKTMAPGSLFFKKGLQTSEEGNRTTMSIAAQVSALRT